MSKTRRSNELLRRLSDCVERDCRRCEDGNRRAELATWHCFLNAATASQLEWAEFVSRWAQARVCGQAALLAAESLALLPPREQVLGSASPIVAAALADDPVAGLPKLRSENCPLSKSLTDLFHVFESFLGAHDASSRIRWGVYYTPPQVARFLVRQLDEALVRDFGLPDGLADLSTWRSIAARHRGIRVPENISPDAPFVQILDPAVGAGIFLAEVVRSVHATVTRRWETENKSPRQIRSLWSRYVVQDLLPRMHGVELLPAALCLAHLHLMSILARTGFQFDRSFRLGLVVGNSLAGPPAMNSMELSNLGDELTRSWQISWQHPHTLVLGNPPFAGISMNSSEWILGILRGRDADGSNCCSYFEAEGEAIRERKHWLQDDYVKFFRYSHWKIEKTGYGLIGLVTNHGYLSNPTFRGMRAQLLQVFPYVDVLDLHGNRKAHEVTPDGNPDENVFEIAQGVAIGVFGKPPTGRPGRLRHAELWGTREQKLAALSDDRCGALPARSLAPAAPLFLFSPTGSSHAEYDAGVPLNQAMPVNSTAAVTARDRFVIDIERDALEQRLCAFRDLSISDDEIRKRFFTRTRSRRYPPGDTRGWKLSAARRRMAKDDRWQSKLRQCLYRPFDRRWIFWADWMIDWPRPEVMRHLLESGNLALIARRQMLPGHSCNFFGVTDTIAIDGVIRSDNRGSESLFPLYLGRDDAADAPPTANFTPAFVQSCNERLEIQCNSVSGDGENATCGPFELFAYIYGLFHSPTYRARYAGQLRLDFPRVLLPCVPQVFWALSDSGSRLIELHCRWREAVDLGAAVEMDSRPNLSARFPRHSDQAIWLNETFHIGPLDESAWLFRMGAHQICRKWLRDRRDKTMDPATLREFWQIATAVGETVKVMAQIDACIDSCGGWKRVFVPAKST
jgi:hypothetical protein